MAQAGATQQAVLESLAVAARRFHGEHAAAPRALTQEISAAFSGIDLQEAQVQRLLELLEKAGKSPGATPKSGAQRRTRDGVTLREYRFPLLRACVGGHGHGLRPRAGGRLGTSLFGLCPGAGTAADDRAADGVASRGLATLAGAVAATDVCHRCGRERDAVLPPCAGEDGASTHQERSCTGFASWITTTPRSESGRWPKRSCLAAKMTVPGVHGQRADVPRAEKAGRSVSHVAFGGSLAGTRRKLTAARAAEFRKAYQYIRRRTKQMRYHEYKHLNLPIGSGVMKRPPARKSGRQPTAEAFGDALVQKQCAK